MKLNDDTKSEKEYLQQEITLQEHKFGSLNPDQFPTAKNKADEDDVQ